VCVSALSAWRVHSIAIGECLAATGGDRASSSTCAHTTHTHTHTHTHAHTHTHTRARAHTPCTHQGAAADAAAVVRDGLRAGLSLDADVAEAYVKALCDLQQPVRVPGACCV
jgi:hypothetical protein